MATPGKSRREILLFGIAGWAALILGEALSPQVAQLEKKLGIYDLARFTPKLQER